MGDLRRTVNFQDRVHPTERVGHGLAGQRVRHPLTVHHEAVFVGPGGQSRALHPVTRFYAVHGFGLWLPVVKRSGDANGAGGRMSEFKADRFRLLRSGAACQVLLFVMFHRSECPEPLVFRARKNGLAERDHNEQCACRAIWGITLPPGYRLQLGADTIHFYARIAVVPFLSPACVPGRDYRVATKSFSGGCKECPSRENSANP